MEARIARYLQEYAKSLRIEMDALIDCSVTDGDTLAGVEALKVGEKIQDIKGLILNLTAVHVPGK